MKTDLFQSCDHCWDFQICLHIESNTFTASCFRIWNSSTGIPPTPLALFIVMLCKAHLTSHSRMSGSRWVITPSWLSRSWSIVNVFFPGITLLFPWSSGCWQLDLWFLCLFWIHVVHLVLVRYISLNRNMMDFENDLASIWNGCSCAVLWTFLGMTFLWDWNENWPFQSCGHCGVFQISWHIECSTLTASSFSIWNSQDSVNSTSFVHSNVS